MKLISWNVNSVRLRLPQVERLLAEEQPDVVCLQETKCREAEFPSAAFRDMGYGHMRIAGQKGYHGVAIVSRHPLQPGPEVTVCRMSEARHVSARLDDIDIHNLYLPAGGDVPDRALNGKFDHKLDCYARLTDYFQAQPPGGKTVILGDLNIAPLPTDVWSHSYMSRVVSHTPIEVEAMAALRASYDFADVARLHVPDTEPLFTWWSYRSADITVNNRGLRLDHVWVSPSLREAAQRGQHHVRTDARLWERPSDHAPVVVVL